MRIKFVTLDGCERHVDLPQERITRVIEIPLAIHRPINVLGQPVVGEIMEAIRYYEYHHTEAGWNDLYRLGDVTGDRIPVYYEVNPWLEVRSQISSTRDLGPIVLNKRQLREEE